MSLRAIKKRETKQQPYNNKYKQQATNKTRKIPIAPKINYLENTKKRSKSYPDLTQKSNFNHHHPPNTKYLSRSESDVSFLEKQFQENSHLLGAKSEVCLKTISVHQIQTVHPRMSSSHAGASTGGGRRDFSPGYHSGDLLNNNQTRRMSDYSVSMYSQGSNLTSSPSDYESRGFADNCVRIPIVGYEVMEERARFTVYKLRVENPFTNDCWLVLRRYTDFVRLNNKLKQTFPLINLQLPRKKLFGDNFNSVFLDNRVQGLQMFVNSVMANNDLKTSKIVREFFCLDEPPTYSESMEECRAIFEAQEETIAHLKMQLKSKDDLILSLQHKLRHEFEEKNRLNALQQASPNCSQCSKGLAALTISTPSFIDNKKV